jgi:hypothetical protein
MRMMEPPETRRVPRCRKRTSAPLTTQIPIAKLFTHMGTAARRQGIDQKAKGPQPLCCNACL